MSHVKASVRTSSPVLDAVLIDDGQGLRSALERGAPPDTRTPEGRTALFQAVADGRLSLVKILLAAGADVNAPDASGETPLHAAARAHRHAEALLLLAKGAEVDAQDAHGHTPLWRAVLASQNDPEMVRLLVEHGADPGTRDRSGVSPRELAQSVATAEVRQLLE